jgi:hypothetical protein
MSVRSWPSITLRGDAQVIPRMCPNCLANADVELRYYYTNPVSGLLGGTRYFQTFNYCSQCAETARAELRHQDALLKRCLSRGSQEH